MRFATGVFLFLAFVTVGFSQDAGQTSDNSVKVRSLTIVGGDLPDAERQRIAHSFQGGAYPPDELAERVRQSLRDLGYCYARVETPQLSAIDEAPLPHSANVSIQVQPGARYHLGEIRFQGASLFSSDQLRRQFPIEAGSLFNATALGKGLDGLKNLYAEKGYFNFGALPKLEADETRHTVDLTIDFDEGKPCDFGNLILDGVEPRAGVGKALLDAWKAVEGKRYSPQLLKMWLAANTWNWPGGAVGLDRAEPVQNPNPHLVSIRLQFP
jgi:outer membrane translocation and assembly module TamA